MTGSEKQHAEVKQEHRDLLAELDQMAGDELGALWRIADYAAEVERKAACAQCRTVEQMFDDGLTAQEIQRYLDHRIAELGGTNG